MALESGSFIDDLVITNPLGTDAKNKGDDHLRLVKKVVKATFPGMTGAAWRVQAKSGAYTVAAGDNMSTINCTAALTLTLTAVATLGNKFLFIVVANGGDVTIDPNSAETVNGSATQVIPDGAMGVLVCNGTLWLMGVMPVDITAAALTVLDDTSVAAMVTTLGAASLTVAQIFTKIQRFTKGGDITSASPLVLDTDGNYFDVTGTTGFSQITCTAGDFFMLQFDGVLTMTDGANLDLGGADIVTAAGDRGLFYAIATNTAQLIGWLTEGSARGRMVQMVNTQTGAVATGTTVTVNDDTIPQNDEGDEYMTLAITPKNTNNRLVIEVVCLLSNSATQKMQVALFQDTTANALAAVSEDLTFGASRAVTISFTHEMAAGTVSSTTFKVRAGGSGAGTTTFNGEGGSRILGGVVASSITIREYVS